MLLASAVAIAIAVRGFFSHDSVRIGAGAHEISADVLRGQLRFDYRTPGKTPGFGWDSQPLSSYRLHDEFSTVYLGFGAEHRQVTQRGAAPIQVYKLLIPVWVLVFVPITLSGLLAWRYCRRQHGDGCPSCGYELVEGTARCPECGAVIDEGRKRAAKAV